MRIDANTGLVSGKPGNDDVGTNIPVSIAVIDAGGLADTLSTAISVINVNDPPVFLTTGLVDARKGMVYSDSLKVSDPDKNEILTFVILESPAWLTVDDAGILSGKPGKDDVGENIAVTLMVRDVAGLSDTLFTHLAVINVNYPPQIVTTKLWDATEGISYSDTIKVSDPDGQQVFTFNLFEGPDWLAIDNAGFLSGIPDSTDVGNRQPVTIITADADGLSDTLYTNINVLRNIAIVKVEIQQKEAFLRIGDTKQFNAQAYNALNSIVETAVIHWSIIGGLGEIDEDGRFTARNSGTGFIVASVTVKDKMVTSQIKLTVAVEKVELEGIKPGTTVTIEEPAYPLDFMSGASILLPPENLPDNLSISMKLPPFAQFDDETGDVVFPGDIILAVTFDVMVDGVVVSPFFFDEPVEITIPFDQMDLIAQNIDPLDIRLFYTNSDGSLEAAGIGDITINTATNSITARVTHFSSFAIASKYAGPTLLGDFDYSMTVDFYDFIQLIVYWNDEIYKGDIVGNPTAGNNAGSPPWYTNTYPFPPDGYIDFEDFTLFALMYNWYRSQGATYLKKPFVAAKVASTPVSPGLKWNKQDYEINDTFTITVGTDTICGFIGAETIITFDDTKLRVKNVSSGLDLTNQGIQTPVLFKTKGGTLTTYTVVLGPVNEGLTLSGDGIITVEFEVLRGGDFKIELAHIDMRDSANKTIKFTNYSKILTGHSSDESIPLTFGLSQNYPNPFNMSTTLTYSIIEDGYITICIYNMLGQPVRKLVNNDQRLAGKYFIQWDGTDNIGQVVTSGVYFATLHQSGRVDTKRIVLMK